MVTIITEKLRNQKLDDIQFEPISQYALKPFGSLSHSVSANITGKTEWSQCVQGSENFWRRRHTSLPQSSPFPGVVPPSDSTHSAGDGLQQQPSPPPLLLQESCCHHRPITTCPVCFQALSLPPAPPKKRHCRSLSIPGDSCHSSWQPQASSIWRPVRSRLTKSRNSPLNKARASCHSPAAVAAGSSSHSPGIPRAWSSPCDHLTTPPETPSPVPRPASASSGFYDGSQGSLYTPTWSDSATTCFTLTPHTSTSQDNSSSQDLFKMRSLSMEEAFSPAPPTPSQGGGARGKTPTAVSMPTLPHHAVRSTPSSPRRQRVPRCRSQPSVLCDRKAGLKRRREESRPTLDFIKMKETALESTAELRSGRSHSFTCGGSSSSKPQRNVQFAPIQQDHHDIGSSLLRGPLVSLLTEPPESLFGLNTIASSPSDSAALPAPTSDRPLTSCVRLAPMAAAAAADAPTAAEEARGLLLSDSGCSDINEDAGFLDSENSCDGASPCAKSPGGGGGGGDGGEEEEEQFDLEINTDLDLEQIEKD